MRDYRARKKQWISAVVDEKTGPLSYRVFDVDQIHLRHIDQLRRRSHDSCQENQTTPELPAMEPTKPIVENETREVITHEHEQSETNQSTDNEESIIEQQDTDTEIIRQPVTLRSSDRTRRKPAYLEDFET